MPRHAISFVVEGGDAQAIADAIARKKTPGSPTYGTTSVASVDVYGRPITINFFRPTESPIAAAVRIKALAGYSTQTGDAIKQAIVDYVNGVGIGGGLSGSVEWADAITAANNVGGGVTFKLTGLTLSGAGRRRLPRRGPGLQRRSVVHAGKRHPQRDLTWQT